MPGKAGQRRARGPRKGSGTSRGKAVPPEVRQRAIELCAAGKRSAEIAKELGLSDRTIRDWRTQPDFDDAVQAINRELRESAVTKLKGLVGRAVDTLEALLDRRDEAAVQRGAAKDILALVGLEPKPEVSVTVRQSMDLTKLTDDELATLAALQAKAGGTDEPEDED